MVLMNKKTYFNHLLTLLIFSVLLLFPHISSSAKSDMPMIWDYAGTFSSEEISSLEKQAEDYYNQTDYPFLVLTTTTLSDGYTYESSYNTDKDCDLYTEAFYNSLSSKYDDTYENCVILTLDLENRYALVTGWGSLKDGLINSSRCTQIYETMLDDLSDDQWFDACRTYYKTANRYIHVRAGVNPNNIFLKTWFQLILAFLVGGVIILINIIHAGGKMTVSDRTYLDNEKSRLVGRHDHYIRTSVQRTKRESSQNNNSSGGSNSSSSHSSGGGHF